jgi:3-dehydroshikimate dehydratase
MLPGLLSVTFRSRSPQEIVAWARQARLAAIEWGGDIHVPPGDAARAREVRRLTEEAGLTVSALGSYYRAGPAAKEGPPFAAVVETAQELGAPCIRVWAGTAGSAETDTRQRAEIVADLRAIAQQAAVAGVRVATEWHAGTLTDTTASALALLREVDHPNLGTFWQPRIGDTVEHGVADLRAIAPWLGAVHVFHWRTVADRRPLAEGEEPWRAYLAEVRACAPAVRFASLEFLPQETLDDLLRDAATLARWTAAAGETAP